MLSYMIFKIIYNSANLIVGEHNYIGYQIKVPKDYELEINKYSRLYLYEHINTIPHKNIIQRELYGFRTLVEKLLFTDLLAINGIGAKTALNLLKNDIEIVQTAIGVSDYETLTQFKGISLKYATLICEYLSSKYANKINEQKKWTKELSQGLSNLGYDKKEIDLAINKLNNLNEEVDISELMTLAIREISLSKN